MTACTFDAYGEELLALVALLIAQHEGEAPEDQAGGSRKFRDLKVQDRRAAERV